VFDVLTGQPWRLARGAVAALGEDRRAFPGSRARRCAGVRRV